MGRAEVWSLGSRSAGRRLVFRSAGSRLPPAQSDPRAHGHLPCTSDPHSPSGDPSSPETGLLVHREVPEPSATCKATTAVRVGEHSTPPFFPAWPLFTGSTACVTSGDGRVINPVAGSSGLTRVDQQKVKVGVGSQQAQPREPRASVGDRVLASAWTPLFPAQLRGGLC